METQNDIIRLTIFQYNQKSNLKYYLKINKNFGTSTLHFSQMDRLGGANDNKN